MPDPENSLRAVPRLRRVALAAAVLLAGCGADGKHERQEEQTDHVEVERYGGQAGVAPAAAPAPPPGAPGVARGLQQGAAARDSAPSGERSPVPTMIIRTGRAAVEVDSLDRAVAQVQALAQRVGGYVANTRIQAGEYQVRQAELELKIPSARWGETVSGLRPLGEVRSLVENTQDVGEEFVDVTARVANARRLEERLLALLANRTGRLEDVLAVERELARVREEIERYEGRLRFLRSRVAMSTLTVVVSEPEPVVGDYPGSNPIAQAFRDAWRNFVEFTAGFIASLGVLIPLGVLGLAFALFGRWLWRRVGRGGGPRPRRLPHPAPTEPTPPPPGQPGG